MLGRSRKTLARSPWPALGCTRIGMIVARLFSMHQSEAAFAFSQRQVPRISSIIWNSFCLCFHEGESHAQAKIKVKLSVPKELQSLSARSRTGYYAPGD